LWGFRVNYIVDKNLIKEEEVLFKTYILLKIKNSIQLHMFYLFLLLLSLPFYAPGSLKPSSSPISQQICNKNEFSDYTFVFSAETTITAGSTIEIEFPPQYKLGLGLTSPIACSINCKLTGLLVIFFVQDTILAGIGPIFLKISPLN
jgi:hypothetical protein